MGIVNKYKINDLAKDFGMQTKQISEILGKYFSTPKKSGQNLSGDELNLVFEYLTQKNQVSSIEVIYADAAAPAEKPAPAKDAQPSKGGKHGKAQQPQKAQQSAQGQASKPQQPAAAQAAPVPQQPAARVPKTKVVDTRKAANVNLDNSAPCHLSERSIFLP